MDEEEGPLWQVNKYRQQKFANGRGRGGRGRNGEEGGRKGEQKFRGIKILSFQGKKEKQRAEQTDRSKSLPRHPLHAMAMLPSPVSVNTHNKRN